MKMKLNNHVEEIDVYIREDGEHYKTSVDHNSELRREVIKAFNELY